MGIDQPNSECNLTLPQFRNIQKKCEDKALPLRHCSYYQRRKLTEFREIRGLAGGRFSTFINTRENEMSLPFEEGLTIIA
jgi:hypothetical protein